MGELKLKIPEEFEEKIKEFPEMEEMIVEFIRLKIFEHELKKSRELQSWTLDILFSDDVKLFAPFRLLAELEKNYALALKLGCPIWAQEKAFKKQTAVDVFSTKYLIHDYQRN